MKYKTYDVFELARDISCPTFNRTLLAGEIRPGSWIERTYNSLWINRHHDEEEFNKWFKHREDLEIKHCRIVTKKESSI